MFARAFVPVVAVFVVGFSGPTTVIDPAESRATTPTLAERLMVLRSSAGCNFECAPCVGDNHFVIEIEFQGVVAQHSESCNPGSCSTHPYCDPERPDAEELMAIISELRELPASSLIAAASVTPGLSYHSQLGTVLLSLCESEVIASIPVPAYGQLD